MTVGSNTDDKSIYGGDLYSTSNSWSQGTVTYNTAPAAGVKAGSVTGAVDLNTSYLFDATPLVTGDGTTSFMVKSTSGDGARYFSSEGGTTTTAPQLQVTCSSGSGDTIAPSQPGGFSAPSPTSSSVILQWTASTDNVGVTGYRLYRDGAPLSTVSGSTLSYTDATVSPSTAYTYQVSAIDAAGNESAKASLTVTTPAAGGTGSFTFTATDDATVDASQPATNLGSASRITVDNSPVNDALVKFTVSGLNGCTVTSARLRLTVGSATDDKSAYGGDVYSTSNSWSQSTVTYNTEPAAGTKTGSVTGSVALNTSYLFDVAPLVSGDGTVSFLVRSTSSDGARYFSKEGGTASTVPQLLVTC
jgi:chitodextrinase